MSETSDQLPELNPLVFRLVTELNNDELGLGDQLAQAIADGTLPPGYDFSEDIDDEEIDGSIEDEFNVLRRVVANTLQKSGVEEPVLQPENPHVFNGYTFFSPTDALVNGLMRVRGFNEFGQPEVENDLIAIAQGSTLVRLQAVTYRDVSGDSPTMLLPDETIKCRWDSDHFPGIVAGILSSGNEVVLINNAEFHYTDMEFLAVLNTDDPQTVQEYIRDNLPDLPPVVWHDNKTTKAFLAPMYIR